MSRVPIRLTAVPRKRRCRCELCNWHRRMERTKKRGSRKELIQLVEDLSDWAYNASADLNYHQAIFDGSWPTAVEQLTRALKQAKQYREKHAEDFAS